MVRIRELLVVLGCFISVNARYNSVMAFMAETERDDVITNIMVAKGIKETDIVECKRPLQCCYVKSICRPVQFLITRLSVRPLRQKCDENQPLY